jgi:hypothetical protein
MALVIRSYVTHLDAPQQAATRHKAKALEAMVDPELVSFVRRYDRDILATLFAVAILHAYFYIDGAGRDQHIVAMYGLPLCVALVVILMIRNLRSRLFVLSGSFLLSAYTYLSPTLDTAAEGDALPILMAIYGLWFLIAFGLVLAVSIFCWILARLHRSRVRGL